MFLYDIFNTLLRLLYMLVLFCTFVPGNSSAVLKSLSLWIFLIIYLSF